MRVSCAMHVMLTLAFAPRLQPETRRQLLHRASRQCAVMYARARKHGLQRPFSKQQVGAWVVLAACVAGMYALQLVILDGALFVSLVVVYSLCVCLVVGLGAAAT